jgi:hypothetical protein
MQALAPSRTLAHRIWLSPRISPMRVILQPRPGHPKKDSEAEAAFKKNSASLVKAARLETTAVTSIEILFQDEARVGQERTHAYRLGETCLRFRRQSRMELQAEGPIGSRPRDCQGSCVRGHTEAR